MKSATVSSGGAMMQEIFVRYVKPSKSKRSKTGLALLLFAVAWTPRLAPSQDKTATPEVDAKSTAELLQMESRFGLAVQKRDTAALAEILAEYYADAYDGSESAISKRSAIARTKAGILFFYRIEKEQQISRSLEIVTIQGLARDKPIQVSDQEPEEKWIRVRRLWTKKDGRWLLIAQMLHPIEEDGPEGKGK
jgi:hypothetical protein